MKRTIALVILALLALETHAQVMFVSRFEVESKFQDNNFTVIQRQGGLVGFRVQPERGFNLRSKLQYFLTDFELVSDTFREIAVRDFYDLLGYDLEGDFLYILLQKGETIGDRYMIEIDLKNNSANEVDLSNVYTMELKEFFVVNRNAVFLGLADLRPVVQILDIEVNNVYTVQGIYFKDTNILQIKKESELGTIDVLVSRRDKVKGKQLVLNTYDEQGNKVREVSIDQLENPSFELVEGIMTPIEAYQQSLIGTYGFRKREAYQGIYRAVINEFGEHEISYYTLEDFPNFFNYLKEKQREKKMLEIERAFSKGKIPTIKPVFSTREVIPTSQGYLIYSDHFLANNPRYIPRDGVYANESYRNNMNRMYMDGMGYMPGYGMPGFPYNRYGASGWQQGEYKFVSAHMLYISNEGQVIWDNAFSLNNRTLSYSSKYGEVSFDGEKLHYLFLDGQNIYMSYIKAGHKVFENQSYEIKPLNEDERVRETQDNSLSLTWWFMDYFLLSGKQKVKYIGEDGKEGIKEVFFLTKIKVDGDQYDPDAETSEKQPPVLPPN